MTSPQLQAASPQAQLHYRISDALGAHDVDFDTRALIQQGYLAAGGDSATWEDLSTDVQAAIEEVEKLPRTSWSDPSDVPDDTPDDF
ncbi:MAG: hypothetical protein V4515_14865 [Chloroflexota bacterium]